MRVVRRVFVIVFIVLIVGGVLTDSSESTLDYLRHYGEMLFLWVAAASIIVFPSRNHIRIALASLVGFGCEVIGVSTGVIFGPYYYTNVLGVDFLGVPIVLVAAWFVLLSYSWFHARNSGSTLPSYLYASGIMVLLDLIIDPVAVGPMGLWLWQETGVYYGIPLQNFLGWLMVSFLAFFVANPPRYAHGASHLVGWAVVVFFVIQAIKAGLMIPVLIGVFVIVADIVFARKQWQHYCERLWMARVKCRDNFTLTQ